MTIDDVPLHWLCNTGVIIDFTEEMHDLAVYTPEMIAAFARTVAFVGEFGS